MFLFGQCLAFYFLFFLYLGVFLFQFYAYLQYSAQGEVNSIQP
jgi:hypothetical protein